MKRNRLFFIKGILMGFSLAHKYYFFDKYSAEFEFLKQNNNLNISVP